MVSMVGKTVSYSNRARLTPESIMYICMSFREKYKENKKRVKGVHDDRRRPSTKDINRPEVLIMLEGLIETQQIGGFYTLQVKQKARANQLVGTEYCSRGYSHCTPEYTDTHARAETKHRQTVAPEIEQHALAAEPDSVVIYMQATEKKPEKTARD